MSFTKRNDPSSSITYLLYSSTWMKRWEAAWLLGCWAAERPLGPQHRLRLAKPFVAWGRIMKGTIIGPPYLLRPYLLPPHLLTGSTYSVQ